MRRRARFVPMVGMGLGVVCVALVIGLGTPSRAQKQDSSGLSEKKAAPDLPSEEQKVSLPPSDLVPTRPAEPPSSTPALPLPPDAGSAAPGNGPFEAAPPPSNPAEAVPVPVKEEDPERAAEAFMDKTRQEADAAIKALTAEADSLRARLKKVEAGLRRWQALKTALAENPLEHRGAGDLPRDQPIGEIRVPGAVIPAPTREVPIHETAVPKTLSSEPVLESIPAPSPAAAK